VLYRKRKLHSCNSVTGHQCPSIGLVTKIVHLSTHAVVDNQSSPEIVDDFGSSIDNCKSGCFDFLSTSQVSLSFCSNAKFVFGPGNGSPRTRKRVPNRCCCCCASWGCCYQIFKVLQGCVVNGLLWNLSHIINDNILHRATVTEFWRSNGQPHVQRRSVDASDDTWRYMRVSGSHIYALLFLYIAV